jgi:hypothetical protein
VGARESGRCGPKRDKKKILVAGNAFIYDFSTSKLWDAGAQD